MSEKSNGFYHRHPDARRLEQDTKKANIKSAILNLYGNFVEGGKPEHIITINELTQMLNINVNQLKNQLFSAYKTQSLNDVLQALGLPYKKINTR